MKQAPRDWMVRFIDDVLLPRIVEAPDVPAELRADPEDASEWSEWIAVESAVTGEDLDGVEAGVRMPEVYRQYFLYRQILDGDLGLVQMPDVRLCGPRVVRHDRIRRRDALRERRGDV